MATLTKPLRVVLCGRTTMVGQAVFKLLWPEYEVIHFIQSLEAAKAELPLVLAGKDPRVVTPQPNDIGTHEYDVPPRAVIFGRGFGGRDVDEIRNASVGAAQEPVAWVMGKPEDVPAGGLPGPGYAGEVVKAVKAVLDDWAAAGGKKDEVIIY